jgi:hypothetical protein
MSAGADLDERVRLALEAENTGNPHQRRGVISDRCIDALLRSALGESDEWGQAS